MEQGKRTHTVNQQVNEIPVENRSIDPVVESLPPLLDEVEVILDKQMVEWIAELRRLSDLIAGVRGKSFALVMISAADPEHKNLAPEWLLEAALGKPEDWPKGFEVGLLNRSK